MMSKARGLILKVNKLSDNDALFTVLCEDMTKITVIAKGIRSMKHKSFAAMQQFCYNDFELNGSGGFFSLSSAALLNNFYNIRTSSVSVRILQRRQRLRLNIWRATTNISAFCSTAFILSKMPRKKRLTATF